MNFRRALAITWLSALAVAACGNYSNEDLEFMNAFPDGDQLEVSMPPRSAAVRLADEAELSRMTHDVTGALNGLLRGIVVIVDRARSAPPSSRTADSRTWGPYPADNHPGWLVRMIVRRDAADPRRLDYELAFHLGGAADTDWPVLLAGYFQAGETARRGTGHFEIRTADVRAAGLDPGFDKLDVLLVDYATGADPLTIHMDITNLPDPTNAAAVRHATYDYAAASDGRREMLFDFSGDIVPGPRVELVRVTSLWLDGGEGRGALNIEQGDGAGMMEQQCWNRSFLPVFSHKDWAPGMDDGDAAACVDVTPLL